MHLFVHCLNFIESVVTTRRRVQEGSTILLNIFRIFSLNTSNNKIIVSCSFFHLFFIRNILKYILYILFFVGNTYNIYTNRRDKTYVQSNCTLKNKIARAYIKIINLNKKKKRLYER